MSGPKTSEISLQEQIRLQVEAAHTSLTSACGKALLKLNALSDEVMCDQHRLEALGFSTADASAQTASACTCIQHAREALAQLQRDAQGMGRLASVAAVRQEVDRLTAAVQAVLEETTQSVQGMRAVIQQTIEHEQRYASVDSFASLMAATLEKHAAAGAERAAQIDVAQAHSATQAHKANRQRARFVSPGASGTVASQTSPTEEELRARIQPAVERYTNLLNHTERLTPQALQVLLTHGSDFLHVLQVYGTHPHQEDALTVANAVTVIEELLPLYETQAAQMAEIQAQLAVLAEAGFVQMNASQAFTSVDEAYACLQAAQKRQKQAAQQHYIQACIDEAMRRHGYNIARSVTMQRASAGSHKVFSAPEASQGVHVFMSDAGDMMMEAVGVPSLQDIEECAPVTFEVAQDVPDAQALLEAQNELCSVYNEIAADLEELGISVNTMYRCAPSMEYNKVMQMAGSAVSGSEEVPSQGMQREGSRETVRADARSGQNRRKKRATQNQTRAMK